MSWRAATDPPATSPPAWRCDILGWAVLTDRRLEVRVHQGPAALIRGAAGQHDPAPAALSRGRRNRPDRRDEHTQDAIPTTSTALRPSTSPRHRRTEYRTRQTPWSAPSVRPARGSRRSFTTQR
jgi:hypothetical protein